MGPQQQASFAGPDPLQGANVVQEPAEVGQGAGVQLGDRPSREQRAVGPAKASALRIVVLRLSFESPVVMPGFGALT